MGAYITYDNSGEIDATVNPVIEEIETRSGEDFRDTVNRWIKKNTYKLEITRIAPTYGDIILKYRKEKMYHPAGITDQIKITFLTKI